MPGVDLNSLHNPHNHVRYLDGI